MSKRKDFKDLFGCDDSDEENVQAEFSSISTAEKINKSERPQIIDEKSKSKCSYQDKYDIMKYKSIQKNDYINTEKHTETTNNEGKEKELKITNEHNKKRIKTKHEEGKLQTNIQKVVTDSEESNNELNNLSYIKHHHIGDGKKKVKLKKTEIGGLVVKLLTPAYVEKRFESRETFKMLARNISHALYDKDEHEIKEYIKNFLNKNEEFTSHTTV